MGPQGPEEGPEDDPGEHVSLSDSVPSFQASHAQSDYVPRGSGHNSYRHQQQRRNQHGNQRNNRQRSRQKARNPFDGFVERANEHAGQYRNGNPNPNPNQGLPQQGGRMRYSWHNPGPDGPPAHLQDGPPQGKHSFHHQNQNWRGGDGQHRPNERPRSGVSLRGHPPQQHTGQEMAARRNSRFEEPMEA